MADGNDDDVQVTRELLDEARAALAVDPESEEAAQAVREAEELLSSLQEISQAIGAGGDSKVDALAGNDPASTPAAALQCAATPPPRSLERPDYVARQQYLAHKPNFQALAHKYSQLAPFVSPHSGAIDFRDADALHTLTQVLFADGFGIRQWRVPAGRLVPPLPNRMNYLLWLSDLLALSNTGRAVVRGLDVGCGANAVYTLLGAAAMRWHMVGIDTDASAIAAAQDVLAANAQLQELISLHQMPMSNSASPGTNKCASGERRVLSSGAQELDKFDFCVCNPPFFTDASHANQNPATADGGVDAEVACEGGEAAFVGRMIDESSKHPHMCHWFSSMLGKKATFKALRKRLNDLPGVTAVRSSELAQGRTHRWVLAWSFEVPRALAGQPLRVGKRCGVELNAVANQAVGTSRGYAERPAKRRAG